MNTIIYQYDSATQLTFGDESAVDGVLLEGSFYNETSLLEDELSVDTMTIRVRSKNTSYPLHNFIYGSQVNLYKDDVLYGKYYLVSVERQTKNTYVLNVQSSIGLLDDTMHYGGIYSGEYASTIIKDIIGGKIAYTEHSIFSKIKVYGWLPVATRRENLKQLLFAVGGCVKKKDGDVYFTTLTVDTPKAIPENKVFDTGKITYDSPASRIEVVEHQFSKVDSAPSEEVYSGEIVGSSFVTPKGFSVSDAALVTWDKPYHSLTFSGCTLLNNEMGVNYAVVSSSGSATISGKPYIHSKMIVSRDKENYKGKEKVAKVENATLVTLANSNSVAEKVMAYYESPCTLSGAIVMDGEKPLDNITMPNQFEEENTGMIKSIEGTLGKQITKGELELRIGYNPPPIYGSRTLVSITVTTPPSKTVYEAGDAFDRTGMVITATYDDNSTSIVKNYSVSPVILSKDDTYVTITYREMGVSATAKQNVTVKNLLKQIAITTPPDETAYEIGDTVDLTGIVVTAYYSDGSNKQVTNYTYSPTIISSNNDTEITISYTEDGITKTTIQEVTVGNTPNLTMIEISVLPDKTEYKAGEFFDPTGMLVRAYFDDGSNKLVKGYTYSPNGALTKNDTTITVSYTKKGIIKTTSFNITIIYLDRIAITQAPTYTSYYDDQSFNTQGMEVTAYYSDNSSAVVTNYTYSPSGILPYGTTQIVVSYTEGGITATTTQAITVSIKTYDYTKSKVFSSPRNYSLADIGATHRNIRVVCIGGGTGGKGGKNGRAGGSIGQNSLKKGGGQSWSSEPSGGAGGAAGTGGSGGKIYQKDFILTSLTDKFSVGIGTGGSGGGTDTVGSSGGDSLFTYNGTTASSATGSSSATGYTNTFTNVTYAISGSEGVAGGDGGDSGYVSSNWRYNHSFIGSNSAGGKDVSYNGTTYSGGTAGSIMPRVQNIYYPNYGTLYVGIMATGGAGGGAAVGSGGQGGGTGNNGGNWYQQSTIYSWAGAGGRGASADAPSAPTTYGNGGNGGNGGGGGGAAGGYCNVFTDIDDKAVSYRTHIVESCSGGNGGTGSSGSSGADGCVIIYFS